MPAKLFSARIIAAIVAFALFALVLWLQPFPVSAHAHKVIACAVLMVTLWVTEAVAMPVVALMPMVLFPLLGIARPEETAAPYANPVIFLFMGGFMIGLAIEKWNLHRRIALTIVSHTGTSGSRIILGFILATGFLSMWLSNTATTMMMYPIVMSVVDVMEKEHRHLGDERTQRGIRNLAICLLLAIAYSANFGGIATIIGTPPNVAYTAFLEKKYGYTFQFSQWMMIGTPMAILLLVSLYWVLTKMLFRTQVPASIQTKQVIKGELNALGPMSVPEKRVLAIFATTALLWITKDLVNTLGWVKLDDNMIAIFGALLLFAMPAGQKHKQDGQLLEWQDTNNMAWGILLLFGGGITLANQLEKAGIIEQMGTWMAQYAGTNMLLLIVVVTVISIFLSEVMSNVAQVIVFAPVLAGLADALGIDPLLVCTPMTLAASCASMLPMGTPPNAIVFASGRLRLGHMLRAGLVMNVISIILITLFCYYLLPAVVQHIR